MVSTMEITKLSLNLPDLRDARNPLGLRRLDNILGLQDHSLLQSERGILNPWSLQVLWRG